MPSTGKFFNHPSLEIVIAIFYSAQKNQKEGISLDLRSNLIPIIFYLCQYCHVDKETTCFDIIQAGIEFAFS